MKINLIKEAEKFKKSFNNLDKSYRERVEKLIRKIVGNPEIGKPMRNARKGTRELYLKPFRLSYCYVGDEGVIILLYIYHKKKQ